MTAPHEAPLHGGATLLDAPVLEHAVLAVRTGVEHLAAVDLEQEEGV